MLIARSKELDRKYQKNLQESFGDHELIAKEILDQGQDPLKVVAALLKMSFNDELDMESYSTMDDISAYKKNKDFYYDDRGTAGYHPIGNSGKRGYMIEKVRQDYLLQEAKATLRALKSYLLIYSNNSYKC